MLDKLRSYLPQKVRAWVYRVILAVQPLAVYYGLLQEQEAALWSIVAGTVLGVGLAAMNTRSGSELDELEDIDYNDDEELEH